MISAEHPARARRHEPVEQRPEHVHDGPRRPHGIPEATRQSKAAEAVDAYANARSPLRCGGDRVAERQPDGIRAPPVHADTHCASRSSDRGEHRRKYFAPVAESASAMRPDRDERSTHRGTANEGPASTRLHLMRRA